MAFAQDDKSNISRPYSQNVKNKNRVTIDHLKSVSIILILGGQLYLLACTRTSIIALHGGTRSRIRRTAIILSWSGREGLMVQPHMACKAVSKA